MIKEQIAVDVNSATHDSPNVPNSDSNDDSKPTASEHIPDSLTVLAVHLLAAQVHCKVDSEAEALVRY